MAKWYRSQRVAQFHPPYRPYGEPEPTPKYQLVRGYPLDCACPSHIAFVGEGPGADEDQAAGPGCGFPFVGRSGEELDRYLLDAYGIDPDSCFITNIGRIYKIGNPDPTQDDIDTWEWLLKEELNVAKPWWIASVGRVSTRYFLGDVDMDTVHGIPHLVVLPWLDNGRGGRVVICPVVHPAAGFRSTEAQALTAHDFAQLENTIRGRLTPREAATADRFPNPRYVDLRDDRESLSAIEDALRGGTQDQPLKVAIDTEGLPRKPWGLSFSVQDGEAYVIRKVHPAALICFYNCLLAGIAEGRIKVLLHNSLHDLRVLRELGMPLPDGCFVDTMVLAYHLCVEPQGLKPLANRHCGMVMDSYDDVTQEAQDRIAVEYYELIEALCVQGITYRTPGREYLQDTGLTVKGKPKKPKRVVVPPSDPVCIGPFKWIEPYTVLERDKETGQLKERTKQPQQVDRRVTRALAEYRESKITAAQLRKRWADTDELVVDIVEAAIGPMREADLDDGPLERSIHYAARDADATHRIEPVLSEQHAAMGLGQTSQIDHATIPMVDRMQAIGIRVDRDYFIWLSGDLERRMVEVQQEIKARFGVWINPNSGLQVADVLFRPESEGGLGLDPTKKTKGSLDKETGQIVGQRWSTQDKVLEGLRDAHPIVPLILDYRGLNKAKTSFADVVIRRAVHEGDHWVIHCNFRITRVSSGRLSATGPNMMAIVGGELGEWIRAGYIAGEGYEFAEWDLNQIEMRVMASESGDGFLISMINNDEDIHAGTADKMFHLHLTRPYSKKQVSKAQRDPAKRTGFGVITGIQGKGLVDQMRLQGIIVSEAEASQWIGDWLAACPEVPVYMEKCHREARAHGFVRDWAGRIRYLPGIRSPFRSIRAEAGRQSHSHKIQAGAQSIMKIGMAAIWREVLPYWWAKGKVVEPILQIHDALMFWRERFTPEEAEEMDAQVRAALYSAAPANFRVPLDAGSGCADTWGQLDH